MPKYYRDKREIILGNYICHVCWIQCYVSLDNFIFHTTAMRIEQLFIYFKIHNLQHGRKWYGKYI